MVRKKISLIDKNKDTETTDSNEDIFTTMKELALQYEDIEVSNFEDNIDFKYYILTGLKELDSKLSNGKGIPRGGLIEIYGPESSGKSHLALKICGYAQRMYPTQTVVYFDLEDSLLTDRLKFLGIDTDKNKFIKIENNLDAESIFNYMIKMIEKSNDKISLIVLDSVAALTPKEFYENDEEKRTALIPVLLSKKLKILNTLANKNNIALIFINQLRESMPKGFTYPGQDLTYTPGGRALKHAALLRIKIERILSKEKGEIKIGDDVVGHKSKVKIVKNKLGSPIGEDLISIYYEEISIMARILMLGKNTRRSDDTKIIYTHGDKIKYKDINVNSEIEFVKQLIDTNVIYDLYDDLYQVCDVDGISKEELEAFIKNYDFSEEFN